MRVCLLLGCFMAATIGACGDDTQEADGATTGENDGGDRDARADGNTDTGTLDSGMDAAADGTADGDEADAPVDDGGGEDDAATDAMFDAAIDAGDATSDAASDASGDDGSTGDGDAGDDDAAIAPLTCGDSTEIVVRDGSADGVSFQLDRCMGAICAGGCFVESAQLTIRYDGVTYFAAPETIDYTQTHHNWTDSLVATLSDRRLRWRVEFDFSGSGLVEQHYVSMEDLSGTPILAETRIDYVR